MILRARGRVVTFPRRPLVMGIVNLNDDSFCADGTLDPRAALTMALNMIEAGADIIDAGAESARTNRPAITVDEECGRLLPFLALWQSWILTLPAEPPAPGRIWPPLLSLNTWRPEVVAAVLPAGGDILNDLGSLTDDRNARLCARHGAALLIMHSRGQPKEKNTHVHYPDILTELVAFFRDRLELAARAGLDPESTLLDPGIDFAKQRADNLLILRELERLQVFHRPLLLPVSRKTVIGDVLSLPDPLERDPGTVACIVAGYLRGAAVFRVHHVAAAVSTLEMLHAVATGADSSVLSGVPALRSGQPPETGE